MHTESLTFRIICFIILVFIVGYILASAIYFNDLKNGAVISNTSAGTMLVVSIIAFVIVVILWIWCTVRLFFSKKERDTKVSARVAAEADTYGRVSFAQPSPVAATPPPTFYGSAYGQPALPAAEPIAPQTIYYAPSPEAAIPTMPPGASTTGSATPVSVSLFDNS